MASLALAAAAWHLPSLDEELNRTVEATRRVQADLERMRRQAPVTLAPADFTAMLPREPDGADVLRRLQSLCEARTVTLGNVEMSTNAPTVDALGQVVLHAVLSGSYVQTRQVLADLLAQLPGAALESARWRTSEGGQGAVLELGVTVWSAPLTAAAMPRPSHEAGQ